MSAGSAAHRGIALVLVLWILALLTIIAVGLTTVQRTESTLARNQLSTARFRAAAEAGIGWAVLNLLAPPQTLEDEADIWEPDGRGRSWTFAGETLEIRVFDEAARIDLNRAERDLLVGLFAAAQVAPERADALADAIEDWRDADDLVGLNGAEEADYEDAGRSYGAKDDPFDSVEELQLLLGIDRDLYRMLAPALTVDSGIAEPKREYASVLVEAALQGVTLEEAQMEQEVQEALAETDIVEAASRERGGPLYRIRISRPAGAEPGLSMEALVRVQARGKPPFNILWRRFGLLGHGPPPVRAGDHTPF